MCKVTFKCPATGSVVRPLRCRYPMTAWFASGRGMRGRRTMRAITTVAAHRLRASWRAWAALAPLIGLAGGVVMTAAAGARRTENAYPQFRRATAAADVLVGSANSGVGGFDFAIGRLPGVSQIAPVVGLNCAPLSADGKIDEESEVAAPHAGDRHTP